MAHDHEGTTTSMCLYCHRMAVQFYATFNGTHRAFDAYVCRCCRSTLATDRFADT